MVNTMLIQPQAVTPREARQGYTARFDNLQEAMGYLKAMDTLETATALDPHVQLASFGPLDGSFEGSVLGQVSAEVLKSQGYDSAINRSSEDRTGWSLRGRDRLVTFASDETGAVATVTNASGFRLAAVSSRDNGILYQEA